MFANSYWDVNQVVTVEYFENGNEPMVTVGYDIYAKNISQGKVLKHNLILALTVSSIVMGRTMFEVRCSIVRRQK